MFWIQGFFASYLSLEARHADTVHSMNNSFRNQFILVWGGNEGKVIAPPPCCMNPIHSLALWEQNTPWEFQNHTSCCCTLGSSMVKRVLILTPRPMVPNLV